MCPWQVLSAQSSAASSPLGATARETVFDRFSTDVDATKAKTRSALLGGLKTGALEAAVAKMEEDLDEGVEEG